MTEPILGAAVIGARVAWACVLLLAEVMGR